MLLDAGGVLVLPNRSLVARSLAGAGIEIDAARVPRAHYKAVRALDRGTAANPPSNGYLPALCHALAVPDELWRDAMNALSILADRRRSGAILWSEPAPGALEALGALHKAGLPVIVVTNSDGHGSENLRDAGICATAPGAGGVVTDIIDSAVVGSAKPDPAIFRLALEHARVSAEAAVHVGDMISTDVAGATAAGITAIHLDPHRVCRSADHRHVRALNGIWQHVAPSRRSAQVKDL